MLIGFSFHLNPISILAQDCLTFETGFTTTKTEFSNCNVCNISAISNRIIKRCVSTPYNTQIIMAEKYTLYIVRDAWIFDLLRFIRCSLFCSSFQYLGRMSFHPSFHPSINLSTHPSNCLFVHSSIDPYSIFLGLSRVACGAITCPRARSHTNANTCIHHNSKSFYLPKQEHVQKYNPEGF